MSPATARTAPPPIRSGETRFDQFAAAIERRDVDLTRSLAAAIRREFAPVHDSFVRLAAATLSHLVDVTSPEEGERIGREAMDEHMSGPWFDQFLGVHGASASAFKTQVRQIVETWHWHPTNLTVTEDDERVTVHTHPCGSGMRLELSGAYDGEDAWHRSVRGSASTFMESDFPMYCNHCPEMNREALSRGASTWLVEGWRPFRATERLACRQHAYKRIGDVPAEFYERVGLEPPASADEAAAGIPAGTRLFAEDELAELSTHPCDRAANALEAGDADGAASWATQAEAVWRGMHDAYPTLFGIVWRHIREAVSRDAMLEVLGRALPELVQPMATRAPDEDAWREFWGMHLYATWESDGRAAAFTVPSTVFLVPDAPIQPAELCSLLNEGIRRRSWDVGTFAVEDARVVHQIGFHRQEA